MARTESTAVNALIHELSRRDSQESIATTVRLPFAPPQGRRVAHTPSHGSVRAPARATGHASGHASAPAPAHAPSIRVTTAPPPSLSIPPLVRREASAESTMWVPRQPGPFAMLRQLAIPMFGVTILSAIAT